MTNSLQISFSTPKCLRLAKNPGKSTILGKALGLKTKSPSKTALDATAGLGSDAFHMACLGLEVTLLERLPLLAQALQRALVEAAHYEAVSGIVRRMTLYQTDAFDFFSDEQIQSLSGSGYYDVIYLDPMFPASSQKRLSKKPMQTLQSVVGDDSDADALLPWAKRHARKRVVVKRHLRSPYLNGEKPDLIFSGKSHRLDVYFPMQNSEKI